MSIQSGDRIVYEDPTGICWWGIALSPEITAADRSYPLVRIQIGGRTKHVPARDVSTFKTFKLVELGAAVAA